MPVLLGLAFVTAALGSSRPALPRSVAWLNGWTAAYIAFCARLVGSLPFAEIATARAALVAHGRSLLARRLCLAPMADELEGAYLIAGTDRPKVDRAVAGSAPGSPPTRSRCTPPPSSGCRRGRCLQRARSLRRRRPPDRRRRRRGLEGRRREGDRRLPQGAGACDDARARRRRAEEGLATREGGPGRQGRAAALGRSAGGLQRWVSEQFGAPRDEGGARSLPRAARARRRRRLRARLRGRQARHLGERRPDHRRRRRAPRRRPRRDDELRAHRRLGRARRRRCAPRLRGAARTLGRPALADDPARRRDPHEPRRPDPPRKALDAQGIAAKDAAVTLKRHPYYVGKLYAQGRNYEPEELRAVTVRLAELDHALKGGSRLAPDLELERALIEITEPRVEGQRREPSSAPSAPRRTDRCRGPTTAAAAAASPMSWHGRGRSSIAAGSSVSGDAGQPGRRDGRTGSVRRSATSPSRTMDGGTAPRSGRGEESVPRSENSSCERFGDDREGVTLERGPIRSSASLAEATR